MSKDVQHIINRYVTCQLTKSHYLPKELYTPLPFPLSWWTDIRMDFGLGLLRTHTGSFYCL